MPTNIVKTGLACGLLLGQLFLAAPGFADESRMAGTVYHTKTPPPAHHSIAQNAVLTTDDDSGETLKINYKRFESFGLITKARDGSLGRDMWNGSKRSEITTYLPELPDMSPYRTMQLLTKRLLLTWADTSLIRQDQQPEPGSDLTTLRLEKLLEMGDYKDALKLYTAYAGEPYHERYARGGILAAFYNRESALACLEAKTVEDRFFDVTFWQQVSKICTYILSKDEGKKGKAAIAKLKFPESKILQHIVKSESYKYKPKSFDDLQKLEPLEAALLIAEGRFDLSALDFDKEKDLPPHVLSLFIDEPSLTDQQSFALMLQAVRSGLKSRQDLATYYDDKAADYFGKDKGNTSFAGYKDIKGWKRLPYLYRAATNAESDDERRTIIRTALSLEPEYGSAALWPFGPIIAGVSPENLEGPAIRTGFEILAESGAQITPSWAKAWYTNRIKDNVPSGKDFLSLLAYGLGQGVLSDKKDQDTDIEKNFDDLDQQQREILGFLYEKLDKSLKFHNYDASKGYEKPEGLTSSVDYVMPFTGLLDDLDKADKEQRLGEIVLLSSIALRDTPPQKLPAGMFREVIDGLVTVGLTNEAQSLAREVILGLSVKKGEK